MKPENAAKIGAKMRSKRGFIEYLYLILTANYSPMLRTDEDVVLIGSYLRSFNKLLGFHDNVLTGKLGSNIER